MPGNSDKTLIREVITDSSPSETESQGSVEVKRIDIVVKSGETGTGSRIRRHVSATDNEQPFAQRASKKVNISRSAQVEKN